MMTQLGLNEFSVSLDLFSDQPHVSQYILPSRLSPGKLFGPYIPSPESSSRIVPQILSPARYYRPDSPELDLAAKDHDSPTHPATKRPKTGSLASLSLIQSIGSGRLWDAFRASATLFPQNGVEPLESLVFKLACPLLLPSQPTNDTYSELQARAAILHEDWIYRGPLKSMQKTLVPAYHGLWGGEWSLEGRSGYERDVWCCLLEDVGEAVDMGTLSEDGK